MKNSQQWKAMKFLAKAFPNKYRLKINGSPRTWNRNIDLEKKSWFLGTIWYSVESIKI